MHLALDPLAASFLLLLYIARRARRWRRWCWREPQSPCWPATVLSLRRAFLLLGGSAALRPAVVARGLPARRPGHGGRFERLCRIAHGIARRMARRRALLLVLAAAGSLARIDSVLATYLLVRLLTCRRDGAAARVGGPLLVAGRNRGGGRVARRAGRHSARGPGRGCLHRFGMSMLALGVAVLARAVDLPSVASRALAAAWLSVVCHGLPDVVRAVRRGGASGADPPEIGWAD